MAIDPADLATTPGPLFIASGVQFGVISDGEQFAIGFKFSDAAGNDIPPIILTNENGVICAELAELFSATIAKLVPDGEPEPTPSGECRLCHQRIFGTLIERGVCGDCEPLPR